MVVSEKFDAPQQPGGPQPEIRIGDPDRHQAMDRLGNYFADGYLDVDEFNERTEAAAIAQNKPQLDHLFADLPDTSSVSSRSTSAEVEQTDAERELEGLLQKGEKLKVVDGLAFAISIVTFGLLIFTEIDDAWVGFILAIAIAVGGRMVLGISDDDEDILDELSESESKRRAERLRLAAKKRREIAQRGNH